MSYIEPIPLGGSFARSQRGGFCKPDHHRGKNMKKFGPRNEPQRKTYKPVEMSSRGFTKLLEAIVIFIVQNVGWTCVQLYVI